jgi:hypothetical protein
MDRAPWAGARVRVLIVDDDEPRFDEIARGLMAQGSSVGAAAVPTAVSGASTTFAGCGRARG